ncbi:MAG: (2Fe-2S)-binding protein [Alphaproteobacteria bacterium]|nr:(2Fe-2S)-binding protein [Alphaproteobacteria bacterium]
MAKMKVNGTDQTFEAEGDTPLLWALRDLAGLTGTKYGCGTGLCGACTVHVNGEAVRSCITPLSDVEGKEVTTIEGLSGDGNHPVQQSWRELNVPQCGFCQAGQIMQAADLLKKNPKPSEAEILDAMSGNVCRCGCYQRIIAAVRHASTGA